MKIETRVQARRAVLVIAALVLGWCFVWFSFEIVSEWRSSARPSQLWIHHREVVERYLDGDFAGPIDDNEFANSILFFQRLTGIEADAWTYSGPTATPGLEAALEEWNEWYSENGDRLYWNDVTDEVEIRP